jgi:hypothetical protein
MYSPYIRIKRFESVNADIKISSNNTPAIPDAAVDSAPLAVAADNVPARYAAALAEYPAFLQRVRDKKKSEYPHVCFWSKQMWQQHVKSKSGISNSAPNEAHWRLGFAEDKDGVAPDLLCRQQLRSDALTLLRQLQKDNYAPESWVHGASIAAQAYVYVGLNKLHGDRLDPGEGMWKYKRVATDLYPEIAKTLRQAEVRAAGPDVAPRAPKRIRLASKSKSRAHGSAQDVLVKQDLDGNLVLLPLWWPR